MAFSALWALAPLAFAGDVAPVPPPVDLGTLGGSASVANGIYPVQGADVTVGGANVFSDAYQHAFYTNALGYIEDLGSLIGVYGNSFAAGVSFRAGITGTSDQVIDVYGDIASHAFYISSIRLGMLDLGTNGGTLAGGNATQAKTVVGASTVTGDVAYCGFSWTQAGGMINLNTLANDLCLNGYNSYAIGISTNAAVAVGNSDAPDGSTHAVAWGLTTVPPTIYDLSTLGGSYAQADAINESGLVVGFSSLPGDAQIDAITCSGAPAVCSDIGNLGGSYAQANGVNDSGVVVGESNITGDTDVHAFVWTSGSGMVDLNTLLPEGSPFIELNSANFIAPDGTIVGVGTALDGQSHAFTWLAPTPGPRRHK